MASKLYYFILNKPFGILSQFTDEDGNPGLGSIVNLPKGVYPVGRLDKDSEGLLLLTNDRRINEALLNPKFNHMRTYWVETEGIPSEQSINDLREGVTINLKGRAHKCLPVVVNRMYENIPESREPDINRVKHPITSWIELKLSEGKNRQVRKMTSKVGHPTLRLIRVSIEDILLGSLQPGEVRQISRNVFYKKLKII